MCISVTGTRVDGGERVGRGFDIRWYPFWCISELELYLLLLYFHYGFQDNCWSIYINYSSSAFNACFNGYNKGLESRLVQLRTQVGVVCWTSGSTRTPRLRFHSTIVCDLLYKCDDVMRARAPRSYIAWSLYSKLIKSKHKLLAFEIWRMIHRPY